MQSINRCRYAEPVLRRVLLAVEAQKVIELRLVRIAWGGAEGQAEMVSMVGEKVVAAMGGRQHPHGGRQPGRRHIRALPGARRGQHPPLMA